jgi:chromosome segregation ATPase
LSFKSADRINCIQTTIGSHLTEHFNQITFFNRRLHKVTERAINKLKALREAIAHTKKAIDKLEGDLEKTIDETESRQQTNDSLKQHRERLARYRKEMRRCTLARDRGFWDDKVSVTAVLDDWKDLKKIREEQGMSNF